MPRKILILGKAPPIQGGVSARTHWVAVQLAQRGHRVHLITNAEEVEQGYRQLYLKDEDDFAKKQPIDSQFILQSSSKWLPYQYYHIPFSKAFSHKLFGLGVSAIESAKPDLIFGWYFEPYAMVATILGKLYNIPVVIKHAGSDIGRIASQPELRVAYQWMLKNASALISVNREQVSALLTELGSAQDRIHLAYGSKLPTYFLDENELNLKECLDASEAWFSELTITTSLLEGVRDLNRKALRDGMTIGTYGKIGEMKGSYDLLKALMRLAESGLDFNFVTIAAGNLSTLSKYYENILSHTALAARTWILPPLPPWRIPGFLNCCSVVCFLERDFPIKFHNPVVPREVIVRGRCLVLSEEVAQAHAFKDSLVDGKNVVLVNPKSADLLTKKLRGLLQSRNAIDNLSGHAKCLGDHIEGQLPYLSSEVQILEDCLDES